MRTHRGAPFDTARQSLLLLYVKYVQLPAKIQDSTGRSAWRPVGRCFSLAFRVAARKTQMQNDKIAELRSMLHVIHVTFFVMLRSVSCERACARPALGTETRRASCPAAEKVNMVRTAAREKRQKDRTFFGFRANTTTCCFLRSASTNRVYERPTTYQVRV